MDAEQRGIAGERTWWRLRIAGGEPWESGKSPGTQTFGKHPQAGEEQAALPPAGNGKANEQRPGQCREDRQDKAEEHCREPRHGCRHAAKNAQADIDPRNAGQKQAEGIGGGDQRAVPGAPIAAAAVNLDTQQSKQAAEAQPVDRKPAERRKAGDPHGSQAGGAKAAPTPGFIQQDRPPLAMARPPRCRCGGCRRARPGSGCR
jgi:hypothetical protein